MIHLPATLAECCRMQHQHNDAMHGAGMFLIASLGAASVYRFLIVLAVVTALYLVYGIHAAAHHDRLVVSFTARCSYFCSLPDARLETTPAASRGTSCADAEAHGAVSSRCGCT